MKLITLTNDHGECYVTLAAILAIDGPMSKKGRVPARALKLTTGALYVHDSKANQQALIAAGAEFDATSTPWGPPEKIKRVKKAKPVEP